MSSVEHVPTARLVVCLLAAGLALAACREGEQARTVDFDKGAYPGGNPSEPVSEEALSDLRNRATRTQGSY